MDDEMMFDDNRFPCVFGEWLVSFKAMLKDQGLYSKGVNSYVDLDLIVDEVDTVLYCMMHS